MYRKMQGHWIIEMSEMIATANAKSIEEIKSFLSRQKETYKIPYGVFAVFARRLARVLFEQARKITGGKVSHLIAYVIQMNVCLR